MTIINASPDNIIQLGWEGEDRVTVFRFRYGEDWVSNGNGIFSVRVLRNGENQAYNAQMVLDDRENHCLLVTLTEVELSKKGTNEMQVVYSGEDFIKKSPVYRYYVSRSVDEPVDPPAQDVYTQIIESLSDLQMDVSGITGNIGNLSELTTEAKTDLVSAINEVNEHGGGGSSVTVDSELSTTSTNPVQNRVVTSAIRGKADIQTVSALSDAVQDLDSDVQGLQTAMQSKVGDVQINGTSIVSNGVANVPIATESSVGVCRTDPNFGTGIYAQRLMIARAPDDYIKNGANVYRPIVPSTQHLASFYGLAKAAGHDEKNSTLPVGQYSEEAKTAIRTMLGLQEMYEWYKNQT